MINLEQERATLLAMIKVYCRQKHGGDPLCEECSQLWDYAAERLAKCPFGVEKPTCQNCTVHCYKPEMRQRVREVMRYAGPRMIWHHPVMAIRHLIHNRKNHGAHKPRRSTSE
jgi:predicted amidophosphoribosyltransferase